MTLLLPTFIFTSFKILVNAAHQTVNVRIKQSINYIKHDFPDKIISWLSYLFYPAISSMLLPFHVLFSRIIVIPIYFWTLLLHLDGRLILAMLCNPKGNGRLIQYNSDVCVTRALGREVRLTYKDYQVLCLVTPPLSLLLTRIKGCYGSTTYL